MSRLLDSITLWIRFLKLTKVMFALWTDWDNFTGVEIFDSFMISSAWVARLKVNLCLWYLVCLINEPQSRRQKKRLFILPNMLKILLVSSVSRKKKYSWEVVHRNISNLISRLKPSKRDYKLHYIMHELFFVKNFRDKALHICFFPEWLRAYTYIFCYTCTQAKAVNTW